MKANPEAALAVPTSIFAGRGNKNENKAGLYVLMYKQWRCPEGNATN